MTYLDERATTPAQLPTPTPEVLSSVSDLIGNTPLVELHSLTQGLNARVLVKLESRNPGGSAKDRIALHMVRTAEANGELAPGATIVESSSGNTGIGLALVGRLTGHPVIIIHSAFISAEKRAVLAAYGAQLVEADWEAGPDDPNNARALADRIAAETPGAWRSSQYDNAANPAAHYTTTGPEIWRQTAGTVTHFVAGIGTGGTVTGGGRYLKDISAGEVRVIGADPVGSTYSGSDASTIVVDGVGTRWPKSNWPSIFDPTVTDEVRVIPDQIVYDTVRRLAAEEALLLGPSSGLAIAAGLEVAATAEPGSVIVVIAPDGGGNYLSKAFNDQWIESSGMNADGFADGSSD
ncbi:PLP-dependent cysteine synthase family protein [Glaciihabitans sp. dw_435]|uniref:PLP-dependent cysteine synthase family protein n=1 Tax=Glaciihabitans sp. dw_435 TaxID=2720081 RepID=UPI001BD390B0|nr:cysteine synthase family protein [Glaciihabitans sp. dw_435]